MVCDRAVLGHLGKRQRRPAQSLRRSPHGSLHVDPQRRRRTGCAPAPRSPPARAPSTGRDRAAPRPDRMRHPSPPLRSPNAWQSTDRQAPTLRAAQRRRGRPPCAATGTAPALPIRAPASADPRRCRRRTPAACGRHRYPRCAAETGRRPPWPARSRPAPTARVPDAVRRWGWARSGRPAGHASTQHGLQPMSGYPQLLCPAR